MKILSKFRFKNKSNAKNAAYSVLKNSTNHPNVDMIYKKLKLEYPAMSLATIYKTVEY